MIGVLYNQYDYYISAGVAYEESFTRDFLNEYKISKDHNYVFDGTIDNYTNHYTTEINFYRKNIGHTNSEHEDNLKDLTQNYKNIFLKMDIEGSEYIWLQSLIT